MNLFIFSFQVFCVFLREFNLCSQKDILLFFVFFLNLLFDFKSMIDLELIFFYVFYLDVFFSHVDKQLFEQLFIK